MGRLAIVLTTLTLSFFGAAAPVHAAAPKYSAAVRSLRSNPSPAMRARLLVAAKSSTAVAPTIAKKIALPPATPKKQRWSRESTGHAVRMGLAIGTPFVAPVLAVHVPILAGGLAIGFGAYAVQGAYEAIRAGVRAAKATPRDGWWTPYDKFASFVGGFFGSREGLSKLFLGGGIGAQMAASVFTAVPAFASVGSELVKSGLLRAAMNIFIPSRVATATVVATATEKPKS